MIHTFKATHCGIAYQGADGARDLTEHMATMHGLKPILPGGGASRRQLDSVGPGNAPGWANGRIQTPIKWAAPKTPKDWQANLARIVAANDDVECDELAITDGHYVSRGLTRFMEQKGWTSQGDVPPYTAMPASVASLVEATVARGEEWHIVVKDGRATTVELVEDGGLPSRRVVSMGFNDGRVCPSYMVVTGVRTWKPTMAAIRAQFGPHAVRDGDAA